MDQALARPFIEGTRRWFSTMLFSEVEVHGSCLKVDRSFEGDLLSFITLEGKYQGMVLISLPKDTALALANQFMDSPVDQINEAVRDTAAEMVNIIAGSAKVKLCDPDEMPINISLPTVVLGDDPVLDSLVKLEWLGMPFVSAFGPLTLWVSLQDGKQH